jgi:hypothetical protein
MNKSALSVGDGIKTRQLCHSEPFAVILSEAKDLALSAQGKLREESGSEMFSKQCEIPRFARNDRQTILDAQKPQTWENGYALPPRQGSSLLIELFYATS